MTVLIFVFCILFGGPVDACVQRAASREMPASRVDPCAGLGGFRRGHCRHVYRQRDREVFDAALGRDRVHYNRREP